MSAAATPRVWFDASITPNVSLSATGLALVFTSVALLGVAMSVLLISIRAWPAALFTGVEIVALVLALSWSSRHLASQEERLVLTEDSLTIESRKRGKVFRKESFEPAWIRLERVSCETFGCQAVYVTLRGRRCVIGEALSPPERASLADALERAMSRRTREITRHRNRAVEPAWSHAQGDVLP
jgi:uncharacterized membrane protein